MIEKDRLYESMKREAKMYNETEYVLTIDDLKILKVSEDEIYNLIQNKPRVLVAYTTDDVYLPDAVTAGEADLYDYSSEIEGDCEKILDIIPTLKLRGCGENSYANETFLDQFSDDIMRLRIPEIFELQELMKKLIKNTEE